MRKETKNGVTYTFETDDLTSEAVDVEVQPGIEYLILEYGLNIPESKKSFPEVKYLTIQKGVKRIEIPNTLFPNVKCVVSKDIRTFESGRYLVSNIGGKTLKNVFCPAEDEVIEIPDNCDLSASYNIGARYFIRELLKSLPATEESRVKAKVPDVGRRTSCTLSTLRVFVKELSAA